MASNANKEIESRGPSVDAAVAAGLQRMGLGQDQVKVIVIDEGSRGLLGIGSREAIVRLIALPDKPEPAPPPKAAPPPAPTPQREAPKKEAPRAAAPQREQREPKREPKPAPARPAKETADGDSTPPDLDAERDAAVDIITTLLEKMRVKGDVSASITEPDDLTGQRVNVIEINGDDLSMLIGPRGETLDSLQFLSRLMVAHRLQQRSNFVVDVEGFRRRREVALTRLAERMADKVRQRGEMISLEPMSAYERRIIHMTLRDAADVYTESAGEGRQRRVRIFPKD